MIKLDEFTYQAMWCQISEVSILHDYCCKDLKYDCSVLVCGSFNYGVLVKG